MSESVPTPPPQLVGAAIWRVAFETLLKFKLGERGEGSPVALSEESCPSSGRGLIVDHEGFPFQASSGQEQQS